VLISALEKSEESLIIISSYDFRKLHDIVAILCIRYGFSIFARFFCAF